MGHSIPKYVPILLIFLFHSPRRVATTSENLSFIEKKARTKMSTSPVFMNLPSMTDFQSLVLIHRDLIRSLGRKGLRRRLPEAMVNSLG